MPARKGVHSMKQEIVVRFALNVARVKNLVAIYRTQLAGAGRGRRSHQKTDVLRAATVLLHASLEDVLRSLAHWKLPAAAPAVLDTIPLVGGTATKFTLGSLSAHKGKTVHEVIKASVDASLERSNYNNTTEVSGFLTSIGVQTVPIEPFLPLLEATMNRRHQIVHRADANSSIGRGKHRVVSLSPRTLDQWVQNMELLVAAVLRQV